MSESLKNNITAQMSENTQIIEKKIKFFEKLYEAVRVNFTHEIENQRNSVVALQGKYERPTVAFCVHGVTDVLLDESNEVIVFKSIITNEGAGYDSSTGIFTAPVGGLYQFAVHLCTPISYYTYVGIVHTGNVIVKDYIHGVGNNALCSSVGGVVRVESGEQVWVQSLSTSSNRKLMDDGNRMNTFLGILTDS
ncbi:complement C1q tumor necrosis factor-related protein 3-like isoform X1 [Ruditapes philippinarum]|uniref:complement C1q tumor necrosis factor-related protein 3-like isoform X1 n=1 Tax=Ruditapes philippinarum TaxID=129788 RepID=UPI00295BD7BA|nr:complement C1q tumor necrosis factor-related protein 3-like isoform X1 [Ruditapes philippinarum]